MGNFDNLKLCAYLFVADSFDNGTNVYEKFCPLIELLLSQKINNYISYDELQQEINNIYNLNISRATMTELIGRLAWQGKIKKLKTGIEVIGERFDKTYFFDKSKKESELSELFTDFYKYLVDKNYYIEQNIVKELMCRFVFVYSYELFNLLNNSIHIENNETDEFPAEFAEHLYNYLIECKSNNKDTYYYFQRLHNGAVQATLLNFNPKKIKEFSSNELDIEQVVLDSNFIMRILDLQMEADCLTAQDTLRILKAKKIKLIVLSETIYEITNTIKNFIEDTAPYATYTKELYKSKGIKFNGLHAAMQRGRTRTDLQEFASYEKIKKTLTDSKIGCIVVDEECALCQNTDIINSLIEAKGRENYKEKQAQHDLALIDWCKKNRSRNISTVKEAKSWVLTNDIKLTNWNKRNTRSSIQECITECQLCHLLWIDEPKNDTNGMISTILALANRNSVNSTQIESFLRAAETYKHKLETNLEIDTFTLALDSDKITTQDIIRAYSSEEEFENMIKNKAKANKEEIKKKDDLIKEEQAKNKIMKQKQVISDTERDIAILENEISQIRLENRDLEDEKTKEIANKDKYKKVKRKAVRITASIFLGLFVICIVLAIFLFPWFKSVAKDIVQNQKIVTLFSFGFSLITSILGYAILWFFTFLIILILGERIEIKELFSYIENKLISGMKNKIADLNGFDINTCNLKITDNETKINDNYNTIKEKNEQLSNLQYNLMRIKQEI